MDKMSPQKDQTCQTFFLYQLQRHINLILIRFNVPDHHGILLLFDFILHDLDRSGKKRVC